MEIVVELDVHNTEMKGEEPYNITVTVRLESIWRNIKDHNRIYISTLLTVPVIKHQKAETMRITLREYYDVTAILSDEKGTFVVMKGYIEGEIVNVQEIQTHCSVWSYDCN